LQRRSIASLVKQVSDEDEAYRLWQIKQQGKQKAKPAAAMEARRVEMLPLRPRRSIAMSPGVSVAPTEPQSGAPPSWRG
jgi:hypothetical protein